MTVQFTSEFWVGAGITLILALLAVIVGLREMTPRSKKRLEIVCWAGVAGGLIILLCHLPKKQPQHTGSLIPVAGGCPCFWQIGHIYHHSAGLLFAPKGPTSRPLPPAFIMQENQPITFNRDGTISTKVLDKDGKLLVTVNHNRWTTPNTPQIFDWNYTSDALEVIAPSGRVVLQIQVLPDAFQIEGEWWSLDGTGVRAVGLPTGAADIVFLNRLHDPDDPQIERIFKYPSEQFLGILLNDPTSASNRDRRILGIAVLVYALGVFSCPLALLMLWCFGKPIV
jgi:hypothetical protein